MRDKRFFDMTHPPDGAPFASRTTCAILPLQNAIELRVGGAWENMDRPPSLRLSGSFPEAEKEADESRRFSWKPGYPY